MVVVRAVYAGQRLVLQVLRRKHRDDEQREEEAEQTHAPRHAVHHCTATPQPRLYRCAWRRTVQGSAQCRD